MFNVEMGIFIYITSLYFNMIKLNNLLYVLKVKKDWIKGCYKIYLLRFMGANIGKNVSFFGDVVIVGNPKRLTIGDNTSINHGVILNCGSELIIGKNCHISYYSQLHPIKLNLKSKSRKHIGKKIIVEDNVWIASGVIVCYGVTIGKNSIISANSLVKSDVEINTLYK